tara:strand:+ start:2372 stop:2803 length:432 start_codon:yes stop_codon:yes gene_type:complete
MSETSNINELLTNYRLLLKNETEGLDVEKELILLENLKESNGRDHKIFNWIRCATGISLVGLLIAMLAGYGILKETKATYRELGELDSKLTVAHDSIVDLWKIRQRDSVMLSEIGVVWLNDQGQYHIDSDLAQRWASNLGLND